MKLTESQMLAIDELSRLPLKDFSKLLFERLERGAKVTKELREQLKTGTIDSQTFNYKRMM